MELVVLSGKGGTGKTTIATALSELANDVIKVDCDVDAPNLSLFYTGEDIEKNDFISGKKATIDKELCIQCGKCESVCRFGAIEDLKVNEFLCEGCTTCSLVCPQNAIEFNDEKIAETFITKVDNGIISRAIMEPGSDGSGKLITQLRKNSKKYNTKNSLIIIDGSPGIGCPVISSITGSNAVLLVTEPTKSGLEDMLRTLSLCEHFGVFTMVCINKYDINLEITSEIEDVVKSRGIKIVGKIPYDDMVMKSINELKPITFYKDSLANKFIGKLWLNIESEIKNLGGI